MADVRLTATNPADSSVVPVACNEKGELKLEEIPDQSFDGNLQGDLTVSGSAEFDKSVQIGGRPLDGVNTGTLLRSGSIDICKADFSGVATNVFVITKQGEIIPTFFIQNDGSVYIQPNSLNASAPVDCNIELRADGSVKFAGNKAGFTAEGYLWCTTRRGDTVILDVTSNGLASWVPYAPPNRLTELQDKWAEKDGILPVPHESSQDEPETPQ